VLGRGPLTENVLVGAFTHLLHLSVHPLHLFRGRPWPDSWQIGKHLEEIVAARRLCHLHECINGGVKAIEDHLAVALRVKLQVVGLQAHLIG
jgi:hypothetical protein